MRITMKSLSAHPDGSLENGQTYDVPGQCSEERAQELLDGGYAVLAEDDLAGAGLTAAAPDAAADPDGDKPLDKMKVDELKAYADEHEIALDDATKKAEILDKITTELARREAEEED
ncbi:hypothetical protein [Streptomyces sp. NPDC051014]|uniref:hypothetical protein n=1 Tax=Streptomyces sp. NPDC051014 TaxID=3155751 RepID=UPI0033FB2075